VAIPKNLKKGAVIRFEGQPYIVLDYWEAKTAQRRATLHVKLRDFEKGKVFERNLDDKAQVELVESTVRYLQYLYADRNGFNFMDNQTFDQIAIPRERMEEAEPFLEEGAGYRVLFLESQPLHVELPPAVVLEVTETAPPAKTTGTSGGNVYKDATLKTGIKVLVPLFIKAGDRIRINTESREYLGKESE
jgi:elongation factor P